MKTTTLMSNSEQPVFRKMLRENTELKQRIEKLESYKIPQATIRQEIIELSEQLTGHHQNDFDLDEIEHINDTLNQLGLNPINKKFLINVTMLVIADAKIEVEAESSDAAIKAIDDGDYGMEIQDNLHIGEIKEYLKIDVDYSDE